MGIKDLAKATLGCGGGSILVYCFPVLGQAVLITLLTVLWLLYARETLHWLRR